MKLYIVFIFLFLTTTSFANEDVIVFQTKGFFYTLNTSPEHLKINGYLINLSFKKQACNESLILSLNTKIVDAFKTKIITENDFHSVKWNTKTYQISKNSKLGKFLFNLPNIIKANKRKEAFLCRSVQTK